MTEKFKKLEVSRHLLYFLSKKGDLEEEMLEKAFQDSGIYPDGGKMASFLNRLMLGIGAIFLICGVIFFFAYNWAELHKFHKLAVIGSLVLISGLFALFQKRESYAHKISIVALCGFTGALFAQFGQIYQTGANAYDLFLGWTLMVSAWVIVSRFPALWVFYVALINTTVILYIGQVSRIMTPLPAFYLLSGVNGLLWIISEFLIKDKSLGMKSRILPRIVGLLTFIPLTLAFSFAILDIRFFYQATEMDLIVSAFAWGLAFFGSLLIYRLMIKDLFFLACSVISAMCVFCVMIFKMEFGELFTLAFLGVCILLITFFTVKFLIKTNKKWKQQSLAAE